MTKNKAITKFILVLVFMLLVSTPIFAANKISMDFPIRTNKIDTVNDSVNKVWGTVITIVQILAFAAVIFAGLRYMFASADQKADIKRSLGILALGAILVFASSTVVKFVVTATNEVIKVD